MALRMTRSRLPGSSSADGAIASPKRVRSNLRSFSYPVKESVRLTQRRGERSDADFRRPNDQRLEPRQRPERIQPRIAVQMQLEVRIRSRVEALENTQSARRVGECDVARRG